MRNLIKSSRSIHGSVSNVLLRFNPKAPISNPHSHQFLKPYSIINPNSSSTLPIHGHGDFHRSFNRTSLGAAFLRFSSSESKSNPEDLKNPSETSEFKHQEIEGPTVERDLSPLANETREVSLRLMKTMYDVSRVLAILGLGQLLLGAWISYAISSSPSPELAPVPYITVMSVVAFALPFSMAFMLRRSLKHMHFFNKMEQIGRLQILTSTMQITKHVHLFFIRLRAVAYLCLAGLPIPLVVSLLSSSSSSS